MKKFGLIGKKLSHSFSAQIHKEFGLYDYDLIETENLFESIRDPNYDGFNVTIPYKIQAMEICDFVSDEAKQIGCINTIVKKDSKIFGYNTDAYGVEKTLQKYNIFGKSAVVFGKGGGSKAVVYALKKLGVADIEVVGRNDTTKNFDAQVVVNATPCGMYPNAFESVCDISKFAKCELVFDLVYNPLCTQLLLNAKKQNIACQNGLQMLVLQAKKSCDLFVSNKEEQIQDDWCKKIIAKILSKTQNVILIGMPGAGKSYIASHMDPNFVDTDREIEKIESQKCGEIIAQKGEKYFRDVESEVVKQICLLQGKVIATGGGAILRSQNIDNLKRNGILIFVDREIKKLAMNNRPLSKDLQKLYDERIGIYKSACDFSVKNNGDLQKVLEEIYENLNN